MLPLFEAKFIQGLFLQDEICWMGPDSLRGFSNSEMIEPWKQDAGIPGLPGCVAKSSNSPLWACPAECLHQIKEFLAILVVTPPEGVTKHQTPESAGETVTNTGGQVECSTRPAQSAQCKATPLGTSQDVYHFWDKKGMEDLVALQFPTAATNGHFMTSLVL